MRREGGYATVWVISAMAVVVAALVVSVGVGTAILERHRAATAADASALAGALDTVSGAAAACAQASTIGQDNGAHVTRCVVVGSIVDIEVSVALPGPLAPWGPAVGRARAGPIGTTVSTGAG